MASVVIKDGLFFDGCGGEGVLANVGIEDGKVTRISTGPLVAPLDAQVVDARGCWVMPGFIDLHTHYDAEVEVLPELGESVRHGVTTVVMGSCSLSLTVGSPVNLADMFCRVEAIPRRVVLPMLQERKDWDGPRAYFQHLEKLPLGPNVAAFLGHSTIRAEAMGMERALHKGITPTHDELRRMESMLGEALDEGYLGLSIMTLGWDKMDGEQFRSRPLPSVFARWSEYRHFLRMLRARDRIFQAVPDISLRVNIPLFMLASMGLFRRKLRTTIITLADIRSDRIAVHVAGWLSRFFNALGADFRWQAQPHLIDLYADGMDLVVFEEFGAGAAALHYEKHADRAKLLDDPAYREQFKKQWYNRLRPRAFHRNLRHSEILACPDGSVVGKSFAQLGADQGRDPVDVFLDLVVKHGTALRWHSVVGNDREDVLHAIMNHPDILIGFSDSGAHLRNMAYYNYPLRMLQLVQQAISDGNPFMTVGRAVQRLTQEIGQWLGIDAGTLMVGRRADVVVVDPARLNVDVHQIHEQEMEGFGLKRLVRRNDDAVKAVLINGHVAFQGGAFHPRLGKERGFGQVLRAK
ncbi:MAG: amidohydrolase family protein [Myxococcota bacterium]